MILIVIVAISSVTVSSALSVLLSKYHNFTVPSVGNIKTIGVEVYEDLKLETKILTIDWDDIWLGTSKNVTIYVRSVSNYKVTVELKATDWDPAMFSNYMTLSWDYNGALVSPGEVFKATLTLSVNHSQSFTDYLIDEKVKDFSFDIHFIAS